MKIMSKRFLSFLLVCVLLCALLPWSALPVHAEFGPGYSARTVQAYQYLAGRIQANGTYNSVLNSYQWKKTIPNGVTFSMQLDKENGDDLSFVLELNEEVWYTPEDEEYDSVCEEQTVGIYTLVLDNGYWQYNEYWVDNYRYVSGYLMYHPDTSTEWILDYIVLPRTFSEQAGPARYSYFGPDGDIDQAKKEAVRGISDILSLIEPYLKQGGYSLKDLGFSSYGGHITHRYFGEEYPVPPCETAGTKKETCYVCGYEKTTSVPVSGHQWNKAWMSKAPTCVDRGVRGYQCTVCDKKKYEYIPELGHDFLNGICRRCGARDVAAPKITTQPKNATVKLGETAAFTVAASGESLTYQWQYQKVGETGWTNYYGGTTASITVKGSKTNGGCKYHCVVSNAGGSVTSDAATLTVKIVEAPVITAQPRSNTVGLGAKTAFTVTATGENLSYKWQYQKVGETGWTDYYGGTTASITVKGSRTNGGCKYRCVVSNEGGSVTSEAAILTVDLDHTCPGAEFTDMPPYGTPEHEAVDWAIETGLTTGTSDTTFSPDKTVTRGQAVTFLWRACGSPEPETAENPFTDVKESSYCYKAVLWANENDITNGTSDTTFSPNKTCSRGHILTFLYRQQGSPEVDESVTVTYTDVKAGAYYETAMKWAYANGIDRGVSATKFAPGANCTRASTVVFLYRAITGRGRLE